MSSVTVSEKLINLSGTILPSVSGITGVIWASVPTTASQAPYQVIPNLSSDINGYVTFNLDPTGLSIDQAVWIALMKDGTPPAGSIRKVTPIYT